MKPYQFITILLFLAAIPWAIFLHEQERTAWSKATAQHITNVCAISTPMLEEIWR